MALDTFENPFLGANFAPVHDELDIDLEVSGEIPAEMSGVLYRNGPNPQFAPHGPHHWFHGDGMVHAFHVEAGRVRYGNRFVRTGKWLAENAAGRALQWSEIAGAADDGIANTNIVWHGGRLLALEETHAPFKLSETTLASQGVQAFGGPVTAHPKFDPETGEMVFFAYSSDGPLSRRIDYGVADAAGAVTRRESFDAPYCSMIHDFLVTRNHVLFPVLPLTGDLPRAQAGGPAYAWEPEKGAFVGVMRRDASVDTIRWFTLEPNYVYHVMNAWESGGAIFADVMQFETAPLFPNTDGSQRSPSPARLARWTFDLEGRSNQAKQVWLDDLAGEFPRFDERRSGLTYRHGWFGAQHARLGEPVFDSLAHIDLATGARQVHRLPAGDAISEPVFVPRRADAEEGDGWITAVIYRGEARVSDFAVFEARDIAKGPIGTARVPRQVPFGFHGNWRPSA